MNILKDVKKLKTAFTASFSDNEVAHSLCKELQQTAAYANNALFRSDLHYVLFRIYQRQGLYHEAGEEAQKGLAALGDSDDTRRVCYLLIACCNIQLLLHQTDISYQFATKAIRLAQEIGDKTAQVKAQRIMARVFIARNQNSDARSYLLSALEILSYYNDQKERSDILHNLCSSCMQEGKWAEALLYGLQACEEKESYQIQIQDRDKNTTAGWVVYGCGEYQRISLNDESYLADSYYTVGSCYLSLGDWEKALAWVLKALSIKENIGDAQGIALCYNTLGEINRNKGDYIKALSCFEQCKEILVSLNSTLSLGYALINVAKLKVRFDAFESSLQLFEEAEQIFSAANNIHGSVIAYRNHAVALRKNKRLTEALEKLHLSLLYAESINARSEQIYCHYQRGLCYHQLTNAKQARESLNTALTLAQKQKLKKEQMDVHLALSEHYQSIKQYKDALEHFQHYEKFKQELYSEESDRRQKNMMILYEVEKHKRQSEEHAAALQRARQDLMDFSLRVAEKQELLDLMQKGLEEILETEDSERGHRIRQLLGKLRRQNIVEEDWQAFRTQFEGLQKDFVSVLTNRYPNLSTTELKVCTLLRMNLRSKDIAAMMHVSTKAVENHRISLRKKMGLKPDANLVKALLELGNS